MTTTTTTETKSIFTPAVVTGKLDKLEYLTQPNKNKGLVSLRKRAKAKFIQKNWLKSLIELDTPLKKKYIDTMKCASYIKQSGEKFTSRYCGNRWCLICNRIRTAKLINQYTKPLDKLEDKQFLTLTRPNVNAENLKTEINYLYKWWRAMLRVSVKEGRNMSGVRKLEITYSHNRNDYHPHLHIIVDKKENAEYILRSWLWENPTADPGAQDQQECYDYKELFKYVTKMTTPIKRGEETIEYFYPEAMDNIFQAIKGARIYQAFGNVLQEAETETELTEDLVIDEALTVEGKEGENLYKWNQNNWYNIKTDEPLTDFDPDRILHKYRKRIIKHKKRGIG
jgi:hypothetical protein